eukprot:TRINITY_DN10458_c0_g1_i1.p1 TRINITY_DN10458_c0_g1~~TRINITY_DN10458_c0_g1_i1.p1  ORF type:complete len:194 (-),score=40.70 TRINITY_DN10458_c0_g1_i1:20-556(-)
MKVTTFQNIIPHISSLSVDQHYLPSPSACGDTHLYTVYYTIGTYNFIYQHVSGDDLGYARFNICDTKFGSVDIKEYPPYFFGSFEQPPPQLNGDVVFVWRMMDSMSAKITGQPYNIPEYGNGHLIKKFIREYKGGDDQEELVWLLLAMLNVFTLGHSMAIIDGSFRFTRLFELMEVID